MTEIKLPMIDLVATGENIRKRRKELGVSAEDIAEVLGITRPSVYSWEEGYSLPTIDNLVALAKVLDVTVDDILETKEA